MHLVEKKEDIDALKDFLPGILKTTTMGYDGKGQYPIKKLKILKNLKLIFLKVIFLKNL